jgi:hypothetical protein
VSISNQRRFDLESLEQRLLLSADGFGLGAMGQDQDLLEHQQTVIEVEAGVAHSEVESLAGDSIFGDFEVEVCLGGDACDAAEI